MNGQAAPAGPAVRRALQAVLAAENAAVFGYGVAGAHLAGPRLAAARRDWAAHQAARDAVSAMLVSRGARPAPAAAAYALPFPVHSGGAAVTLAALLEDRVATAYLGLVGLSGEGLRGLGARGLRSAALRAAAWRGRTVAFPGLGAARSHATGPAPAPGGAG
jgi:Domain of unknown function (DUF4439)